MLAHTFIYWMVNWYIALFRIIRIMASASAVGSSDFIKQVFDHKKWLAAFSSSNHARRKDLRVEIMRGTLAACKDFKYSLEDGTEVKFGDFESVSKDAKRTSLLVDEIVHVPRSKFADKTVNTKIVVVNTDCLKEGIRLREMGFNPAVLNMASPRRPGGGYLSGAGAQEENLFRRTNYVQHLADPDHVFDPERKWKYRLPEFSCVYSTNVLIIRASEQEGYGFLPNPVPMSFVAVAAYPNPPLTRDKSRLTSEVAEKTKRKIRVMMATGLNQGHDSLVLSALGCGAFRNPPGHMALLFQEVLSEAAFSNKYKHISFAILDDHNARGEGNFKPFLDRFRTG